MNKWQTVSLDDLLQLERRKVKVELEKSYQEIGIYCFGRGIFHKTPRTGFEVGNKDLFLMKEGDFILQVTFAWEGAIAIVSDAENGMYGSTRYPTFRVDETRCVPKFLLNYFKTAEGLQQLVKICPGSAGRNRVLSIKRIPEVQIPLPPLSEQKRIVAQIEELSTQINEARALRQQAIKETEALLTSFRRAAFGETPQSDWVPLSNYIRSIVNGKSPATEGRPATLDEWAVLKVGAVSFGVFDEKENKALPVSYVVPPSMEVRPGDFIMSRANTVELVGACALVRKTRPKLMLSDKTFRFDFHEPRKILPEYLEQLLKSPPLREQIERGASGTSPTMKNISKEKVLALQIPQFHLPEQRRIVAELDALQAEVDSLKTLQSETSRELDALLPSILDRAFKGEL
ncbi:MAG: restriction endonuclease subunit S [Victivallales bacterium]